MTDHKFTDEELERTLHICSHYAGSCSDYCPLRHDDECVQTMARHALALINRQNAELDDLKRDTIPKLQNALERANYYGAKADEEIQYLKAEIESLNISLKAMRGAVIYYQSQRR